jgi:GTP-binding protein
VAFCGRSNVGKSSLINALTGQKALARVSQTPGRTRQLNFFDLAGRLVLVDLPGYGYAKASKDMQRDWQGMMFDYLRGRPNLMRVMLLLDARIETKSADRAAMDLLNDRRGRVPDRADQGGRGRAGEAGRALRGSPGARPQPHRGASAGAGDEQRDGAGHSRLRAEIASLAAPA